jgi:hypothetical protein
MVAVEDIRVLSGTKKAHAGTTDCGGMRYRARHRCFCLLVCTHTALLAYDIPRICHERWQHLLRNEAPSLGTNRMCQYSRRSHSPRPFCSRSNMWIDSSCITHVVDPTPKEGLDRCSEVESDHTRCDRSHTRCLHACCWGLVRLLRAVRGAMAMVIAVGSDSSPDTGAGRHRISWRSQSGCRRICGWQRLWVLVVDKLRVKMSQAGLDRFRP